MIIFGVQPIIFGFNGLVQHGSLRWLYFGLAASWLVYLPILRRQQGQTIRNYERQNTTITG